eukprot:310575_1
MNIILITLLYSSFYISNIYGQACEDRDAITPQDCMDLDPTPQAPCGCECPNTDGDPTKCDNEGPSATHRCTITLTCAPTQIPTASPTVNTPAPIIATTSTATTGVTSTGTATTGITSTGTATATTGIT